MHYSIKLKLHNFSFFYSYQLLYLVFILAGEIFKLLTYCQKKHLQTKSCPIPKALILEGSMEHILAADRIFLDDLPTKKMQWKFSNRLKL